MAAGDLTEHQRAVLIELEEVLGEAQGFQLVDTCVDGSVAIAAIDIDTSTFEPAPGGLPVDAKTERVFVVLGPEYPFLPPTVGVNHSRWIGHPHVLQGTRLCIFLDENTEWDPSLGIRGFLCRLWEWFDYAVAARFDAASALYHPVGGVLHRSPGAPTVVVAEAIPTTDRSFGVHRIVLRARTDARVDLVALDKTASANGELPGVLVMLPKPLPLGGGSHLSDLLLTVRDQRTRKARRSLETRLRKASRVLGAQEHLHVIIVVPNPAIDGQAGLHLIGWRLRRADVASALDESRSRLAQAQTPGEEPCVEWTFVDDVRPAVATRRDDDRTVGFYQGKTVELWGCGALGSWIGELLARAGVKKLILRDAGYVTRGLLVRQNYTEEDVGRVKAEALVERLRLLSDSLDVEAVCCRAETAIAGEQPACDLIIDATVNTSVAVAIDEAQSADRLSVPVVQVATDNDSATLAIVTIALGGSATTSNDIDFALRKHVEDEHELAPFLSFWSTADQGPITPTIGCSVPTFRGSAADAASVASSAITLAATALSRRVAGGYLIATPHTQHNVPARTHVPAPTNDLFHKKCADPTGAVLLRQA